MSMVEVTKSKSGEYWRMAFGGDADILDHEPTDSEMRLFVESVIANQRRAEVERSLPRNPNGGSGSVQVVTR